MPLVLDGTNGVSGVDGTASNPAIEGTDSNTGIFYPAADTVAIGTGGTERLRVDSAGNVGIGTSSPNTFGSFTWLTIVGKNTTSGGAVELKTSDNSIVAYTNIANGAWQFVTNTNHPISFQTNNAERARITSGGDFLIGTTTLPASGGTTGFGVNVDASRGQISLRASTTGTTFLAAFYNPNGNVGAITTTGSATSYVTSSDYRLKENIQPMTGALATVSALKPCTYTWKSDGSAGQGFVAHELQEVVPDCVTGEKDAVNADGNPQYQGVDTSFLVATLTAAIQELNAKVEAQAAEIAALKGNA